MKGRNRLCAIFFLLFFSLRLLAGEVAGKKISVSFSNIPLKEAILKIEVASGYTFFYDGNKIDLGQKVSLSVSDQPIESALHSMLKTTKLTFEITNKQIALFSKQNAGSPMGKAPHKITGTVVDALGSPIIGANVMVKGTNNGTITDLGGNFLIEASENDVLQVSYIGYMPQDIPVQGNKEIIITVREDTQALDEVVVVGYGTQKKVNLTGSVSSVKFDEELANRPITDASQALSGKVSGVWISQNSGKPGDDGAQLRIRGWGTLNNSDPLVIIDGVEGVFLSLIHI